MSSQDKKLRGKAQRKSAFVDIFSRIDDHDLQHGGRDVRRLDGDILLLTMHVFLQRSRLTSDWDEFLLFFYGFSTGLKIYFIFNSETVGSHTSSGRDSLHVARRQRKPWRQFDCRK